MTLRQSIFTESLDSARHDSSLRPVKDHILIELQNVSSISFHGEIVLLDFRNTNTA